MPSLILLWGIALAAVAAVVCSVAIGLADDMSTSHVVLMSWLALSYVLSGVVAWRRRPANRLGPLMILAGFSAFGASLSSSANSFLQVTGQVLDLLPLILVLHVFLAFPSGRAGGVPERVLLGIGYTAAIGGQLVVMAMGGFGLDHPLAVVDLASAAVMLHNVELIVISAVALAGVAVLIGRRRAQGRPLRRMFSIVVDSFALGLVMIAILLLVGVIGGPPFPVVQLVSLVALGLAPIAFLAGLLNAGLGRLAIGNLIVELRTPQADLRAALARALRDSSLSIAYWLPDFQCWVDESGKEIDLPVPETRRAATIIERDGVPVAALLHHPALREETELLDAVSAAGGLALENARLRAEQQAHLEELRGSRIRVIEAGRKERERLERNLHDGAQQRLVSLSLDLGILQAQLADDAVAGETLSRAKSEIALSLDELRSVARGLHPAVLSAHGLGVALESLTARAPVPVQLTVDVADRLHESVEIAAYYVVSEGLTNIGKHAHANSARVNVGCTDHSLVVEVVDDGVGGADTERGTGLRGLADRVEALGGRLQVWTPHGGGTRVRAEIPCA